jgi:NitT/TauT family transport system permease protein
MWRMSRFVCHVASVSVLLLIWQGASTAFNYPALFPGPLAVGQRAISLIWEGRLGADIAASLGRVLTGFVLGSVLGVLVGFVIGSFQGVRVLLEPYMHFLRFITPIAWISPVMIWFGIGETSKVILIMYTTMFAVMLSTVTGVTSVPRNRIRAAQACGASASQIFRWVVVPTAVIQILQGMRLAMGYSFMTVIPAEMLAAQNGLGYLIINSRLWLETDTIFVGILSLGTIGLAMDWLFRRIIDRIFSRYSRAT